jgi:transcriptional regulator of arginine metabolism
MTRQLLEQNRIESQDQLQKMLQREGVVATQATISRDLRDLGVMKGPRGYMLPQGEPEPSKPTSEELRRALQSFLFSARPAQNLIVLKTGAGQAGALANELDHSEIEGVVGTVAGDDTIFIATGSARAAKRLLARLMSLAGR